MKRIIPLLIIALAVAVSCRQETGQTAAEILTPDGVQVASGIIYNVTVLPESDDSWENEKVAGYNGKGMIDGLFEGIYNGTLKVSDYHTGNELNAADIKRIEQQAGFERENIGRIQFTEDWYFNAESLSIEKRVTSVVFGYRSGSLDNVSTGFIASFTIHLN